MPVAPGEYPFADSDVAGVQVEAAEPPAVAADTQTQVAGAQVERDGELPFTGGDVLVLVLFGVGAVAVGLVLARRARPRTTT
ncbi:MAG: hypothetical protein M5U31_03085 [Acidimicrobiia bacterium]|nr:hypothetical protein [Acidimicrobiia bacterium]